MASKVDGQQQKNSDGKVDSISGSVQRGQRGKRNRASPFGPCNVGDATGHRAAGETFDDARRTRERR